VGQSAAGAVRYLYPAALFFIAVGVYSTNNSLFEVGEVLVFGVIGAVFVALKFPVAPILLGYVLGPLVEENFRRAMFLSQGDPIVLVQHPISAAFIVYRCSWSAYKSTLRYAGSKVSSNFPDVARDSSSVWASGAFSSGNTCSIESLSQPAFKRRADRRRGARCRRASG